MILFHRCWFCGDLAVERDGDDYLCSTHYDLVKDFAA